MPYYTKELMMSPHLLGGFHIRYDDKIVPTLLSINNTTNAHTSLV